MPSLNFANSSFIELSATATMMRPQIAFDAAGERFDRPERHVNHNGAARSV
jgi:hypothetical protein